MTGGLFITLRGIPDIANSTSSSSSAATSTSNSERRYLYHEYVDVSGGGGGGQWLAAPVAVQSLPLQNLAGAPIYFLEAYSLMAMMMMLILWPSSWPLPTT